VAIGAGLLDRKTDLRECTSGGLGNLARLRLDRREAEIPRPRDPNPLTTARVGGPDDGPREGMLGIRFDGGR